MKRAALIFLSLIMLGGCTVEVFTPPMEEHEHPEEEDLCELVVTLEVVRAGNTYWTNELEIHRDKLGLDCRRVAIREEWIQVGGILLLFSYETWECYRCSDV